MTRYPKLDGALYCVSLGEMKTLAYTLPSGLFSPLLIFSNCELAPYGLITSQPSPSLADHLGVDTNSIAILFKALVH
jgi:hypothetical protein